MKTGLLFDVPATRPSHARRLHIFKRENCIETHDGGSPDLSRWMAAHMPSCRRLGYGNTPQSSLFDCVANTCRLMDEAGLVGYGRTEREAVRELCEQIGQPFTI